MFENGFIVLTTELRQLISTEQAWYYTIIPKQVNESYIEFYSTSSNNIHADELEMLLGKRIVFESIDEEIIRSTLNRFYQRTTKDALKTYQHKSEDFLNDIVNEARELGCSDIHLEAFENKCRVRMRLDGKLVERYIIDKFEYPALVNKIKIRANLDIAEKRLPQDGRIYFQRGDEKIDLRISIMPALFGEKVVLRLLNKDATHIELNNLGFDKDQLEHYYEAIKQPHGIILISGPTGSGKTTTLYATLKELNQNTSNILTIEDPIEYTLEGINQVQLNEGIGLTFAKALRTFLRQDPDIIMLGEIRDSETAQMAIRAALTGHLVLSTIHTNSAWGIISRLIDMGIPRFLLSGTLNLAVSQRLVRLLCIDCKEKVPFNRREFPGIDDYAKNMEYHFKACGCEKCFYTGYKGRRALYEVIPIDYQIAQEIKDPVNDFQKISEDKKIKRLVDAAAELLKDGLTSLEEVYPVLISKQSE